MADSLLFGGAEMPGPSGQLGFGISQTELANRMGVRQPFISDIERGGRTPTVATLSRIAQATGNRLRLIAEPV